MSSPSFSVRTPENLDLHFVEVRSGLRASITDSNSLVDIWLHDGQYTIGVSTADIPLDQGYAYTFASAIETACDLVDKSYRAGTLEGAA